MRRLLSIGGALSLGLSKARSLFSSRTRDHPQKVVAKILAAIAISPDFLVLATKRIGGG
jgi:hypothetical protein